MNRRDPAVDGTPLQSPLARGVLQRHGVAGTGHVGAVRDAQAAADFELWFAGSKAVDAQGGPLTLFHGTPHRFDVFDLKRAREGGFYVTADPEHAEMYAGPRGVLMPVHVAIRHPMRVEGWQLPPRASQKLMKQMIADAKAGGHDGVFIERFRDHVWGTSNTYIAFAPSQIRRVFYAGTYAANAAPVPAAAAASIANDDGCTP